MLKGFYENLSLEDEYFDIYYLSYASALLEPFASAKERLRDNLEWVNSKTEVNEQSLEHILFRMVQYSSCERFRAKAESPEIYDLL